MRLYKFRPLSNILDFDRAKQILETKHFWCAKFSELNDPMEGAFTTMSNTSVDDEISSIYGEKSRFKICSLSGQSGFENPSMWGYYANGFRGMCIEVDVEGREDINEIQYEDKSKLIEQVRNQDGSIDGTAVRRILMTKLKSWQHENEYRFLIKSENNYHEIGKITQIYFGDPYWNFNNKKDIFNGSKSLQEYEEYKKRLEVIARGAGIKIFSVEVQDNKVVPISCNSPLRGSQRDIFSPPSEEELQSRRSGPR